jgi:hypothetical protein
MTMSQTHAYRVKVIEYLKAIEAEVTGRAVTESVTGNSSNIREALNWLVVNGFVGRRVRGRTQLHSFLRDYALDSPTTEPPQPIVRGCCASKLLGLVQQSLKYHPLSSFPGYCYFARLPDGIIKIGYSNTASLMHHRMRSLSKQYGDEVVLLKHIEGGFVAEALMHDKFKDDRLPGPGERFSPSSTLLAFINAIDDYSGGPTIIHDPLPQYGPCHVLVDHTGK